MSKITFPTLAGLLVVGLTGLSMPQSGPSPWVVRSGVASPDEAVAIQYTITLTEPYLRLAEPQQMVRLVSVATCIKGGEVLLVQQDSVKGIAMDESSSVTLVLGPVNLGYVETFAAQALGLPAIEPTEEESPRYEMSVSPASGKTWADVASQEDLVVDVAIAQD